MQRTVPGSLSGKVSTVLRVIRVLIGLAVAVFLCGWTWIYLTIDREFIEKRINTSLANSTSLQTYRFGVGTVDVDPWGRTIEMRQVVLIHDGGLSPDVGDSQEIEPPLAGLRLPLLRLEKIRIASLLFGDVFRVGRLFLAGLHIETYCCEHSEQEGRERDTTDAVVTGLRTRIVESAPAIQFEAIDLLNGSLAIMKRDREGGDTRLTGISVHVENFELSKAAAKDTRRKFFSRAIELEIDSISRLSENGSYWMTAHSLKGATRSRSILLDTLTVWPIVGDDEFQQRLTYRKNRVKYAMTGLQLKGLAIPGLDDEPAIVANGLVLDSVYLDIFKDKRLPEAPGKATPIGPQEVFRRLGIPMRIDSLNVRSGMVAYHEIHSEGEYPGKVWFDRISVSASRLCSDAGSEACEAPSVFAVRSRFMGQGALHATFEIPLLSNAYDFNYWGELGPMPAVPVNEILTNLTGLRIEEGMVDGLTFDINVSNGVAGGRLDLAYRDLEMEFVGKVDRDKTLIDHVKTFVVSDLMTHHDNVAGRDGTYRHAEIEYVWDEDPFFRFVWRALRDGILDTIKK